MKKKPSKVRPPEVEEVRLKPLFGMEPGMYLTILYGLLLLGILFALLLYPGLRTYGSQVTVSSEPEGAALYVDGVYRGSTPVELFLSAGEHELRLTRPHFSVHTLTEEIGGRRFGSLFFPRTQRLQVSLSLEDRQALLEEEFRRFSGWSMVGSFHRRYRCPAVAADTVAAVLAGDGSTAARDDLSAFVYYLTNNMSSSEQTADLLAAAGLLYDDPRLASLRADSYPAGGSVADPAADPAYFVRGMELFRQAGVSSGLLSLYGWLSAGEEYTDDFADSLSLQEARAELEEQVRALPFEQTYGGVPAEERQSLEAGGHLFISFDPPEEVPVGNEELALNAEELSYERLAAFPHMEEPGRFYLAAEPVSQEQFARFLRENPQWGEERRAELAADEQATEQYLRYPRRGAELPVTNVSWFAARAYCRWLTEQLPQQLQQRYRADLPSEGQWEYAARMNGRPRTVGRDARRSSPAEPAFSRAGSAGLIDMLGNVWEWNRNWYFPADVLDGRYGLARGDAEESYAGVERAVRGGSWANEIGEKYRWTRGSQPPHWCTPFTGFRPALLPRR